MLRTPEISPATVIGEIRAILIAELEARPAPEPVVVSRSVTTILAAVLSEQIDQIEVLAESAAAADRLGRELRIARAECRLLEQQLIARDLIGLDRPAGDRPGGAPVAVLCTRGKSEIEGRLRGEIERRLGGLRPRRPEGAVIVDLTEALARERRDAERPMPPTEGGAA